MAEVLLYVGEARGLDRIGRPVVSLPDSETIGRGRTIRKLVLWESP